MCQVHVIGDTGVEEGVHTSNDEHPAAAVRQQRSLQEHMPDAASTGVSIAAASPADHRSSSQPQQGVTSGFLGVYAAGSSPVVADSRRHARQGSQRRSVQFATTSLSGRKDVSTKRHREEDAATPPPLQEPATLARGHLPRDQQDMAQQIGVASAPGMSAQKASGSKLPGKKPKSRPNFVEGF